MHDAPFRFEKLPADTPPDIVRATHAAAASIAFMCDLHPSCRRRECRDGCSAEGRLCGAEFPPEAEGWLWTMLLFLLVVPVETVDALQRRVHGRK